MRRLIREPLVHFLFAGALLFAAYAWLNCGSDGLPGGGLKCQNSGFDF